MENSNDSQHLLPKPLYIQTLLLILLFSTLLMGQPAGTANANPSDGVNGDGQNPVTPQHIILMRHALAPGTGDPGNFSLRDCSTQRNLSQQGRNQAVTIGNRLRSMGVAAAQVFSSQWCRCLETAELLDLGKVEELALLNSFFNTMGKREPQTNALQNWLSERSMRDIQLATVLVTHQVNITALTGIFPASGEMLMAKVLEGGGLEVVKRIRTDY